MDSKKTFKTVAKTSLGNLSIEISVWRKKVAGASRWTHEGFVEYNNQKFEITAYWETICTSRDLMKHLGAPVSTQIKADFSEVEKYKEDFDKADRERIIENSKYHDSIMNEIDL